MSGYGTFEEIVVVGTSDSLKTSGPIPIIPNQFLRDGCPYFLKGPKFREIAYCKGGLCGGKTDTLWSNMLYSAGRTGPIVGEGASFAHF